MKVLKNINIVIIIFVMTLTSCSKDDDVIIIDGQNGQGETIVGQGPVVTQTLSLEDFTGINLTTAPNVTISQGAVQEVKAIGYANIIEKLKTNVVNNVWTITFQEGVGFTNFNLSIEITVPNINTLIASSSGSIVVEDFENQNELLLETSSSGNITINQFEGITELAPIISSSGNITANQDISTLQTLNVNISSDGDFNGFPIISKNCSVNISLSGHARVTANNTLDVTISSSGNVYYKGNPTITQNLTSSGQIIDSN